MHFSTYCPTHNGKPSLTTACRHAWGEKYSVMQLLVKEVYEKVLGFDFALLVCFSLFTFTMISCSLSSAILRLLIFQRGFIRLAIHSRSANIKSIMVLDRFSSCNEPRIGIHSLNSLPVSHLQELSQSDLALSFVNFCSRNLHQHVTRLLHCQYPRHRHCCLLNSKKLLDTKISYSKIWFSLRKSETTLSSGPKLQFFMQTMLILSLQLFMAKRVL